MSVKQLNTDALVKLCQTKLDLEGPDAECVMVLSKAALERKDWASFAPFMRVIEGGPIVSRVAFKAKPLLDVLTGNTKPEGAINV